MDDVIAALSSCLESSGKIPIVSTYVWSGLLVILGLYLNVYTKNRKSWDPIIYRWLYKVGIVKNLPPSALPV